MTLEKGLDSQDKTPEAIKEEDSNPSESKRKIKKPFKNVVLKMMCFIKKITIIILYY